MTSLLLVTMDHRTIGEVEIEEASITDLEVDLGGVTVAIGGASMNRVANPMPVNKFLRGGPL